MNTVEYTCNAYPSFGKKYNNEIGVISLTSWKARIDYVSKTLFSLLKQCPEFHVTLVLAEEEFPKMMNDLPENLRLFAKNELVEIMFVKHNYLSFKKVLFALDKYRNIPVISADDDCIYTCNYAQMLYDEWLKHKDCIITNRGLVNVSSYRPFSVSRGPNTLFTYSIMKNAIAAMKSLFENKSIKPFLQKWPLDDSFYSAYYYLNKIKIIDLSKQCFYKFQHKIANNTSALHNSHKCRNEQQIIQQFVKLLSAATNDLS